MYRFSHGDKYTLAFVMSLPLLHLKTQFTNVCISNLHHRCHIYLPYITCLNIKINHPIIKTTRSHASCRHHCQYFHHCNVYFVLFHNSTYYTNHLLSRIHVNTSNLLNIKLKGLYSPNDPLLQNSI